LPIRPLLEKIDFRQSSTVRMTITRNHENLNRLGWISFWSSDGAVSSSAYLYNNANQRTRLTNEEGAYWVYAYDNLGQVLSGKKYWAGGAIVPGQQFECVHDDIGNWTTARTGGDANGANLRTATYTPNRLNQYSSRTNPGYAQVTGISHAEATVTVNSGSTYRHNEYFKREITVSNSSAPQYPSVTVSSILSGNNTSRVGNLFVPQATESYSHDLDGNLTGDGRWTYKWNGENRLIEMEAKSNVPSAARLKLVFEYDWQGRRIRKQVFNWTGSDCSATPALDLKYVYDGWNLLAELNGTNNSLVRGYTWGNDLSGSRQVAGGVGGLLMVKPARASVMFAAYDGNGNLTGLVDRGHRQFQKVSLSNGAFIIQ
jgi:YD repeat-containing protein